jgi:hypothetical protein
MDQWDRHRLVNASSALVSRCCPPCRGACNAAFAAQPIASVPTPFTARFRCPLPVLCALGIQLGAKLRCDALLSRPPPQECAQLCLHDDEPSLGDPTWLASGWACTNYRYSMYAQTTVGDVVVEGEIEAAAALTPCLVGC